MAPRQRHRGGFRDREHDIHILRAVENERSAAMQPNIAIPLFLVAPEDRRSKVIQQVNRPTFDWMKPPLVEVCRYISFEGLREALESASTYVKYLKADWLQTLSESCAPDEA